MYSRILLAFGFVAAVSFAEEAPAPAEVVSAEANVAAVENAAETSSIESELKSEIAVRDSVMAVQAESCSADKDSLRRALEVEQAKSANWEQSYETIKKDNALCAQALTVSIGVNEKKSEITKEEKLQASTMAAGTFLGGIGVGMLIFYLIFGTGGK